MNVLKEFEQILTSNDLREMEFYLEYLEVLIDFFECRKMNAEEFKEEKFLLEKRIKKIH